MHHRGVSAAMSCSQKEGFQPTLGILVGLHDPLGQKKASGSWYPRSADNICNVHVNLRGIVSMVKLR